ncbi:MAG: histidine kinase [Solobacterium sp.]|nr:histidine kinase [Solobacterium sp.]
MTGLQSYPLEVSMCIWAIIFSLLVCLMMALLKKVMLRNCILFFFWFMVNIVFQILEITSLGRPDVLAYRSLIEGVYLFNTVVILAALAAGINRGLKNAFRFRKEEWLYILVNTAGVLGFLLAESRALSYVPEQIGSLPMILWTAGGILPPVLAGAADVFLFPQLHKRLRRSSPRMLYVFSVALGIASLLFVGVSGLSSAGTIMTVLMMVLLCFYGVARLSRKTMAVNEQNNTAEAAGSHIPVPESEPLSASEEPKQDRVIREVKVVKEFVAADPSLLAKDPHFTCSVLNNVVYLIDHDGSAAKKSVIELSDYLIGKYRGLQASKMIPFETELRTMNRYLSLMYSRYPDEFRVVNDYAASGFMIPGLTLVTAAEHICLNILLKQKEKGTLRIETRKEGDANVVRLQVEDHLNDTVSLTDIFEIYPLLSSVKERLEQICEGSFEVRREAGNTVFEFMIPIREDSADLPADAADPV